MTTIKSEHIATALFFLIAVAFCFLAYKLFVPFFIPIAWAAVFAILFSPLNAKVKKRVKKPTLSAAITTFVVLLVIVGPMALLLLQLVSEAGVALRNVNAMYESGELERLLSSHLPSLDYAREKLAGWVDLSNANLTEMAKDALQRVSNFVINQTSVILSGGSQIALHFLLMTFSLYYFFKDGGTLIKRLQKLMPLNEDDVKVTFRELRDLIFATIYSGVMVAVLQGIAGGILFASVGIPSAVFWGSVMAFLSVLPIIGAFLVYVPAGLILIISGNVTSGIIVLVVGGAGISQIDNFLRPMLVSNRSAMHPMILFFSMMGGVALFGLLGIILGPVVAAIFLTILRVVELSVQR
ncbi:MAG: AI-2E family transporter [Candidatus Zixiibacteriota bacterium]